MIQATKYNNL